VLLLLLFLLCAATAAAPALCCCCCCSCFVLLLLLLLQRFRQMSTTAGVLQVKEAAQQRQQQQQQRQRRPGPFGAIGDLSDAAIVTDPDMRSALILLLIEQLLVSPHIKRAVINLKLISQLASKVRCIGMMRLWQWRVLACYSLPSVCTHACYGTHFYAFAVALVMCCPATTRCPSYTTARVSTSVAAACCCCCCCCFCYVVCCVVCCLLQGYCVDPDAPPTFF
jgi:hypothetical protein